MRQKMVYFCKRHCLFFLIFSIAILLRVFFAWNNWPLTSSEEGTMGLEAMHILLKGEHPVYFYGQYYMGVAEAYIGAVMFRLFGISVFSLRLGMMLLFATFLVLIYMLSLMLYNKRVALWTLALLAIGPEIILTTELEAVGGAVETLVCGTALLLLASWIVLRSIDINYFRANKKRFWGAYGLWGLIAGLGLWSHLLVVPFVFASGVLLLLLCRHLIDKTLITVLVVGLLIGASPLIAFNIVDPQHNAVAVFWGLHQTVYPGAPTGIVLWIKQLIGTFFYTLPLATGMVRFSDLQVVPGFATLFHIGELQVLPLYGPLNWQTLIPIIFFGGWSTGYVFLLIVASRRSLHDVLFCWKKVRNKVSVSEEERQHYVLQCARWMLLLSGWLTILSFLTSATAAQRPWSFRYLIGLLVLTPAIIFAFEQLLKRKHSIFAWKRMVVTVFAVLVVGILCLGTVQNFFEIPSATNAMQNQAAIVQLLEKKGIVHVYSGYWVCDRLIFASQEKVICSVVEDMLQPGLTRYTHYHDVVRKDPNAAYIFTTNADFHPQAAIEAFQRNTKYREIAAYGYLVFY